MKKKNSKPAESKNQAVVGWLPLVSVAILAVVVGFVLHREKQRVQVLDTRQILSYQDFPIHLNPNVALLATGEPHNKYLAAEVLLKHYPKCVPCLFVLSEAASSLMGIEEAVEASSRLLELVPGNYLAIDLHKRNVENWVLIKNAVKEQQERFLQLPDDRVDHRWAPVTELPDNHTALAHSETISDIQKIWRVVKFQEPALAADLIEIMQRQWAVETGRIENLYILSEGATQSLIAHGISMNAITSDPARSMGIREGKEDVGRIKDIIVDQKKVVESIAERIEKQAINVTKNLLIELQLAFTSTARFTDAETESGRFKVLVHRGAFKNQPNYPLRKDGRVHQYCPYSLVDEEIDRLLKFTQMYQEQDDIAPEVLAAWLHHRFVQIHPFHDGNGRVARSITTLVLMKAGLLPFTVRLRDRRPYILALEKAYRGDLGPFVDFIVQQQRETLLSALTLSGSRASHILSAFENRLHEMNLPDLNEFAEIIEMEIEAVVKNFTSGSEMGKSTRELATASETKVAYQGLGFVVPSNITQQKHVVWEISGAKLLFYVLQLHPRGWGIFVAVGMAQIDGQTSALFDGEFFPFGSTALQSKDECKDAIRSWLRHHLFVGFVSRE